MAELPKIEHEIRDPIHDFIQMSTDERAIVNSDPVQRLRWIRQLALTELVYPGCSHKRFEHSLGTMHLASMVFDVVTRPLNLTDEVRQSLPEITDQGKLSYWRNVLRMAALSHDLGHLPFSHAAESQLLPEGWNHERLSRELITSDDMTRLWESMTPPLKSEHIVKLAVGKAKAPDLEYSVWEEVLSEIVVGDAFGVDRIDYLLRDSHHAGVAYGRFDHHRLVNTLRILPGAPRDEQDERRERPPALGVEQGGLHAAEALLLARYFMFSQVYFHPVRRVYDLHLIRFLEDWLPGGKFSVELGEHLAMSDNEVLSSMARAARDAEAPGHDAARRIFRREHYKLLYDRTRDEAARNPEVVSVVAEEVEREFGQGTVISDEPGDTRKPPDFPVLTTGGDVVSSETVSDVLKHMPVISLGYAFIRPDLYERGREWLAQRRMELTQPPVEDEGSEGGEG